MVINIAGTSGSGKSYLMRSFMDWAQVRAVVTPERVVDRKAPIGYLLNWSITQRMLRPTYIVGAYESPTGGCDTIRDVVALFEHIQAHAKRGEDVLYEGLFVMNMQRGPQLAEEYGEGMVVLQLTTPFATCVASINDRRSDRGEGKLLKKENTKGNYVRAGNYCQKMRAAGAMVIKTNREDALSKLIGIIKGD